jgi:translation initiation factor IF-3
MIRIPQVRVVDEEGAQLGVMPTPRALEMAQERGLDLVEVAPMAAPPVVKFLDFGQYKYDLTKREKEAKRKQRSVTFKEVRLSPKIGTGDFDTKVHRAIEFLEDGDRIKVTVRFRGRELTHPELGRNLLAKFVDRVKEHGVAERTPLLEGKSMHITMASLHKPKTHDAPAARGAESQNGKAEENIERVAPTAASAPVAAAARAGPATAVEPSQAETSAASAPTVVTAPASAVAPAAAPATEAAASAAPAPAPAAATPAAEEPTPAAASPAADAAPATAPKPAASTTKTPSAPKPRAEAKTTKTEPKKTATPAPEPVTSGE